MSWNLTGVLPLSYRGPSFEAGQSKILTESLELAHNGFWSAAASSSGGGGSIPTFGKSRPTASVAASASASISAPSAGDLAARARSEVGGLL